MDWIDDLIYGKLPLQKMFELFYSWINSPVQRVNSWMQLWVAANTEGSLMVGKSAWEEGGYYLTQSCQQRRICNRAEDKRTLQNI